MQYRSMGPRVSEQVSALGFGCMRFPKTEEEPARIERVQSRRMLEYAIEHGVNYVDTAWPYHGGESEEFVGEVLSGGLRERVLLATKLPMWEIRERADLDRIFAKQLEKLRTDSIDFYLMHALNEERRVQIQELDILAWAQEQKRAGRIRYLGFSFHDEWATFPKIVEMSDGWDFCQIQYNYLNEEYQAGTKGLTLAAERGLGVVVMEPLLGGSLANVPEVVDLIFDEAERTRSAVEWAFDWLWDKPEVGPVLSGMSTMEQVEEDVAYASRSAVGMLTDAERALFPRVEKAFETLQPVPCTQCRYCMPCPYGVDIPGNFDIYNTYYKFADRPKALWQYNTGMPEEKRASACVRCMKCVPKCPQGIMIPDSLSCVVEELATA